MSTSLYILPHDPALFEQGDPAKYPTSDLRIDSQKYTELLLARWPGTIAHGGNNLMAGTWTLTPEIPDNAVMNVLLHNALQVVSFRYGFAIRTVKFIVWHRSIIPKSYDLWLISSSAGFRDRLFLNPEITEEAVEKHIGL